MSITTLKGLRTYIWAAAMPVIPTILIEADIDWAAVLTDLGIPQKYAMVAVGVAGGVITAYLRTITTTPPLTR